MPRTLRVEQAGPKSAPKTAGETLEFHGGQMRRLAEINDLGPLSFRSVEINDKAGPLDRVTARYVFARGSVIFEHSTYRIERATPEA